MRIIAGTHRGRRFNAPPGMSTRPTTDRVREALFSILGPIDGLRIVDCYAGSGALGLEALSRGARHVAFIESGHVACRVLRDNVSALGFEERATILPRAVERCTAWQDPLDLVLSDPPWPIAAKAAAVVTRTTANGLSPEARVVLGHPKRLTLPVDELRDLDLLQTRAWGDSAFSFFVRTTAQGPNS